MDGFSALIALGERIKHLSDRARTALDVRPGVDHSPAGSLDVALEAARSGVFSVVLLGGTRVGKSTLLDALAGAAVSPVGTTAATTRALTVLCPASLGHVPDRVRSALALGPDDRIVAHDGGLHGNTVLVDTPDFDSYFLPNRDRLMALLPRAHVVLAVVTPEKYRDVSLFSLLARERRRRCVRAIALVLNKIDGRTQGEVQAVLADLRSLLAAQGLAGIPLFAVSAREALDMGLKGVGEGGTNAGDLGPLERFLSVELDGALKEEIDRLNLRTQLRSDLADLEQRYGLTRDIVRQLVSDVHDAREALLAQVPSVCARAAQRMVPGLWASFAREASAAASGPLSLYLQVWSVVTWAGRSEGRRSPDEGVDPEREHATKGIALPAIGVMADPAAMSGQWGGGGGPESFIADGLGLALRGVIARYKDRRAAAAAGLGAHVVLSGPMADQLARSPSASVPARDQLLRVAGVALTCSGPSAPGASLMRILSFPSKLLVYLAPVLALIEYLRLRPEGAIAVALTVPLVGLALLELERQVLTLVGAGRIARAREALAAALAREVVPLLSGIGNEEALSVLEEMATDLAAIEQESARLGLARHDEGAGAGP